jgi:hypothetical protein
MFFSVNYCRTFTAQYCSPISGQTIVVKTFDIFWMTQSVLGLFELLATDGVGFASDSHIVIVL